MEEKPQESGTAARSHRITEESRSSLVGELCGIYGQVSPGLAGIRPAVGRGGALGARQV